MDSSVVLIFFYILLVMLVIGLGYIFYLWKEKDIEIREDYYGLNFNVFNTIKNEEYSKENIKAILKIIKNSIIYVEENHKFDINLRKENIALKISKDEISKLNLKSKIDDESVRIIIRIGCAFMLSDKK
ncbi:MULTISPECIES: hypothetical protein [Clostridium]|uniref:hypothetical protein n=1 Tax=Clostridium TaxID=1485 RepID=UPI00069DCB3B|nr:MULTISPECIES: hypothetical protein [Clostridium]KOF56423.1 hypothetical protein AGR56_06370 [Clostridium sp. DMHC 10]MCD2345759.1 hypothetical protein [Clostridium guangxiense]